jgi:hypothetical protein
MRPLGLLPFAALYLFAACATYDEDLIRSQRAFEQSEHERALAILRKLEPDTSRFSTVGRAHYAYLRGMTDFRIGYRSDARHWLAIASSIDRETPGSLPPEWEKRMGESLKELNEEVYSGGIESLSRPAPSTEGKPPEAEEADGGPQ